MLCAGLQVLIDDGKVFACHETLGETIFHSEMGSSAAILHAGYNIDSFMVRDLPSQHYYGVTNVLVLQLWSMLTVPITRIEKHKTCWL